MADNLTNTETSTSNLNITPDYKVEYEKLQADYAKLKNSFDKASSDIADFKRKDKDRMSEEQRKTAELEEREEHYKAIEKENSLYKYKSALNGLIKDEKVLNEIAECYSDGNIYDAIKKTSEYSTKMQKELEKSIKLELLQQNPQSTPSGTGTALTKEQIMAIKDPYERQIKIAENINLFK